MRQLLTPVPSIAAGAGPFVIRDRPEGAGGCCAPPVRRKTGVFQSPFSVFSPLALGIRAHEYGHLGLWRQRLAPSLRCLRGLHRRGIHQLWIQGTLDVVVNHFMMARGNHDIRELVLWCDGLGPVLPRWIAANLYIRAEGLRHASLIRMSILARQAGLTDEDLMVLDETSKRLARWGKEMIPLSKRKYKEMLISLQGRFGPDSCNAEHLLAQIAACIPVVGRDHCRSDEVFDGFGPQDYRVRKGLLAPASIERRSVSRGDGSVPWGSMEILSPPLTHRCRAFRGMTKRNLVCGYTGAFRYPSRALLPAADGRAFTRRNLSPHDGTLLIDCSGSMSKQVTHDRLMAVLRYCPAATIGLYTGQPSNRSGSLLIAARNGMHVAREVIDNWGHLGNIVDGPALQWLSQQKAPRVWVSDGEVTGMGERSAPNLLLDVDMLMTRARIRRVPTLDDYLQGAKQEQGRRGAEIQYPD